MRNDTNGAHAAAARARTRTRRPRTERELLDLEERRARAALLESAERITGALARAAPWSEIARRHPVATTVACAGGGWLAARLVLRALRGAAPWLGALARTRGPSPHRSALLAALAFARRVRR